MPAEKSPNVYERIIAGVRAFEEVAPSELVEEAKRIVAAAGMELGAVEYVVNERDGLPYFYDINALSNFVANAPDVIGFDPFVDLVDFLFERTRAPVAVGS